MWEQNRTAAVIADRIGLDFVMSMGKFRGFGGETDHWGTSLESVAMMAAIAEATTNVRIWATLHPMLHNPAVAAKMITTLDHISGGRAGLNIVAGAYKGEFRPDGRVGPEPRPRRPLCADRGVDHDRQAACGASRRSTSKGGSSR